MKNFLKKLIDWLIKLFSTSPVPSPTPSPTRPVNPVIVMVTNRDGLRNIIGVKINDELVNDIHYPIRPMDQSVGTTKQLYASTSILILFDGPSVDEQIVVGNACISTNLSDMCIVDYVNTMYGVTIHYQNSPCNKLKATKPRPKTPTPRKKKTK